MNSSEKELLWSEILIQVDNMQCMELILLEVSLLLCKERNACCSMVDKDKCQGTLGFLNLLSDQASNTSPRNLLMLKIELWMSVNSWYASHLSLKLPTFSCWSKVLKTLGYQTFTEHFLVATGLDSRDTKMVKVRKILREQCQEK